MVKSSFPAKPLAAYLEQSTAAILSKAKCTFSA
jgi:hypothetical protein